MAWFGITPSRSSRLLSPTQSWDKQVPPGRPLMTNMTNHLLTRIASHSQASGSLLRCRYDAPSTTLNPQPGGLCEETRFCLTEDLGAVILYGVNSAQNAMMRSDEWKNDARNPNAKSGGH
ncbi:mitochondrial F1F0 ATP synthase subunit Atp18 [Apiospora arundinis]